MDPSSVASAAAGLLGITIQLLGALYGDWNDASTPVAERLIYELSQLRTVLQTLESASLAFSGSIIVLDLPEILEDIRKTLSKLETSLLAEDNTPTRLSLLHPTWNWKAFDPEHKGGRLPLSRGELEGESLVLDLQLYLSRLRAR